MKKNILVALLVAGIILTSAFSASATFGNGSNGFWVTPSDSVLAYKSSLQMKFKMNSDFNFGEFDSFEVRIWDTNATAPLNTDFINSKITKTISTNTAKTEVSFTLKSNTITYDEMVNQGLDPKIYYLMVDLRKNGDTSAGLDNFSATPIRIAWDLTTLNFDTGDGWMGATVPELEYTRAMTVEFEGFEDQFKDINNLSEKCSFAINGLDGALKSDYFKIIITKLNARTIRVTIESEAIPTLQLYEKAVEAKKYSGYILFDSELNIPTKYFKVDLTALPTYTTPSGTGTTTDYPALISALNAEIATLNAQIATLEGQTGSTAELSELRSLRNTAIAQLFEYGTTNDSSNTFVGTALATAVNDGKNWKQLGGLGYASGSALFTDFTTYKAQATNPSCTPCNYTNYVTKSTYDGVVAERATLTAKNTELVDKNTELTNQVATAKGANYLWGIAGLIIGAVGMALITARKPKNGNRPRPPVGPPQDQRLKPHRHKGGVPPEPSQRKKKEYIGRD